MIIKNGTLFCEGGSFRTMDLKIQNGHIAEIGSQLAADGQESLDATNCYVVPGLVDIHIHGAVGADFSDGEALPSRPWPAFCSPRASPASWGPPWPCRESACLKSTAPPVPSWGKRFPEWLPSGA